MQKQNGLFQIKETVKVCSERLILRMIVKTSHRIREGRPQMTNTNKIEHHY